MTITWPLVLRSLRKQAWLLVLFPAALAGVVVYFTQDMPREYTSTASLYTGIASGYSITSTDNQRLDNTAITNAFDNLIATIKARETVSEVSLRLLARHLSLRAPHFDQLGADAFENVQKLVDATLKKATVKGNEDATFANLQRLAQRPGTNTVKYLLYESTTYYAVESILNRVTVARRGSSDMLDLSCKSDDPAVCQQTLVFLIDVFKRRYTAFRFSETGNVVAYFEEQVRHSLGNLKGAEDRLTRYDVDNRIINYDEQSKYVASSREVTAADYVKEKMGLQAAQAAREALERKLDEQGSVLLANADLSARRTELAKAQTQLANASVYGAPAELIRQRQDSVARLSDELRVAVRRYYNSTTALGSMPQRALMDSYVENTIRFQEASARVAVMEKRLQEFDEIYTQMAPVGSSVNRLEREIGVAEREYLSILHGLNMARLRQKNLEMSGTLTVLDPPLLPMKPQPSIRKLLIIAAFLAGLVLALALVLGRALLNQRIATPDRAEQLTELPLAAAFPAVKRRFARRYDLPYAEQCAIEHLRSNVLLETLVPNEPHAPCRLITLFSTRPATGKSWVGERLSNQFARAGHRVVYFRPETSAGEVTTEAETVTYPVEWDFADTRQIGVFMQLIPHQNLGELDYIFLEMPDLRHNALPVRLIGQSDLSLLVARADLPWRPADAHLLAQYRKAARRSVMVVLDAVEPDLLTDLIGPVPRRGKGRKTKKAAVEQPDEVEIP
jgi:uncharacterized protein involved in exopolysaccharide biosynthesis